jgi:hypothetical protein
MNGSGAIDWSPVSCSDSSYHDLQRSHGLIVILRKVVRDSSRFLCTCSSFETLHDHSIGPPFGVPCHLLSVQVGRKTILLRRDIRSVDMGELALYHL